MVIEPATMSGIVIFSLALHLIIVTAQPTCNLGVLKAAPGAVWQQNRTTYFDIYVSSLAEPRQQKLSRVPPTPLEAGLVAELRPPLPPSTRPRLCLRSLAAAVAGAGGGCAIKGLTPSRPGVLGTPHTSWACLEVTGGEASSKRVIDNNDATCAMVSRCYVSGTSWTLKSVGKSPGGNPQLQLTYSTWKQEYDDISNRYNGTTSTMVYQLTSGCILGQSAPKGPSGAASPRAAACVACSAAGPADPRWTPGHVADASSPTCVRCLPGMAKKAYSAWVCEAFGGGVVIGVRVSSTGVPECASADGKKCSRAPTGMFCTTWLSLLQKAGASGIAAKPLRCGADHKRAWGITGWDTPGHWCHRASDRLQDSQPGGAGPCKGTPLL